jgi:cytochrome b
VADIATGRRRVHLGHTPLGALMIYNLLLTLLVITASGYAATTFTFWGVRWVKEVHEAAVTWAEVSVVLHILAVIWESRRTGVNLPRAMVTGYKEVPTEALIAE